MKMKYLYMSFLLALVYSCSDSGDNSDYSEMLKKDFNQEIKWDVDSLALMRASWEKTDLGNGAAVCTAQASMWGTTQSVSYVVYPTTMFSTRVAVCDTPAKTSMIAKDKKALFAINGSYSISGNPSTFTMVDKVVKVASTIESASKVNGVIAIDAEGSVDVKSCTFSDYTDVEDEYESALASGPMLLMEGKVCSFPQDAIYTQRMARSVIGITAQGKMMLLTIDGAITGNADGATLEEAAFIAKTLGMKNAVCLADGSSSTLWTSGKGVVNHPVGNGQYDHEGEGTVSTVIYVAASSLFDGGDGTVDNPYLISNRNHMRNMMSVVELDKTYYFEMTNDVDMTGIDWKPLNTGEPVDRFDIKIHFDGKGHTIRNLHCEISSRYASFFGVMNGSCRNVRFENAEVIGYGSSCTGIVAGYLGTNALECLIENVYVSGTVSGIQQVGGIGGIFAKGTVRNCYADVKVIGSSRAGGIVAEPRNAVVVENCFATGTLYSTGNAGGIAGGLNGNNPTIKGCIAWNEQIDGEPVSGRVIGWQSNTYTKATDCYAKKDMIIAWGPNKGMTGADANTAGTYDWGNNKTAICHGITTENSVDAAKKIGWSTDIWDLSGVTPLLKSFNDKNRESICLFKKLYYEVYEVNNCFFIRIFLSSCRLWK